jgi:hypothetical protein
MGRCRGESRSLQSRRDRVKLQSSDLTKMEGKDADDRSTMRVIVGMIKEQTSMGALKRYT